MHDVNEIATSTATHLAAECLAKSNMCFQAFGASHINSFALHGSLAQAGLAARALEAIKSLPSHESNSKSDYKG